MSTMTTTVEGGQPARHCLTAPSLEITMVEPGLAKDGQTTSDSSAESSMDNDDAVCPPLKRSHSHSSCLVNSVSFPTQTPTIVSQIQSPKRHPRRISRVSFADSVDVYSVPARTAVDACEPLEHRYHAPLSKPVEARGRSRERVACNSISQCGMPYTSSSRKSSSDHANACTPPPLSGHIAGQYSPPCSDISTPPTSPRFDSFDRFPSSHSPLSASSSQSSSATNSPQQPSVSKMSFLSSTFVETAMRRDLPDRLLYRQQAKNAAAHVTSTAPPHANNSTSPADIIARIRSSLAALLPPLPASPGSSEGSMRSSPSDGSGASSPCFDTTGRTHPLSAAAAPATMLHVATTPLPDLLPHVQQLVSLSVYLTLSLIAGACLACIVVASYGLTFADDVRLRIEAAAHHAADAKEWVVKEVRDQAGYVRNEYWEKELKQKLYREVRRRQELQEDEWMNRSAQRQKCASNVDDTEEDPSSDRYSSTKRAVPEGYQGQPTTSTSARGRRREPVQLWRYFAPAPIVEAYDFAAQIHEEHVLPTYFAVKKLLEPYFQTIRFAFFPPDVGRESLKNPRSPSGLPPRPPLKTLIPSLILAIVLALLGWFGQREARNQRTRPARRPRPSQSL